MDAPVAPDRPPATATKKKKAFEEQVLALISADPEFQRLVHESQARAGQFDGTLQQVKQLLRDDLRLQTDLAEFRQEQVRRVATTEPKRCIEAFRFVTGREPDCEEDVLAGAAGLTLRRMTLEHAKEWAARLNGGMPKDRRGRPKKTGLRDQMERADQIVRTSGCTKIEAAALVIAEDDTHPDLADRWVVVAAFAREILRARQKRKKNTPHRVIDDHLAGRLARTSTLYNAMRNAARIKKRAP